MAGPGAPGTYSTPAATPTTITAHDYSSNPDVIDNGTVYWYTFTPATSGLVTIDLYLSVVTDTNTQPPAPQVLKGYIRLLDFTGFMDFTYQGGRQRALMQLTAGTPMLFGVYGWVEDGTGVRIDTPASINVRVSDVVDPTPSTWTDTAVVTKTFGDSDDGTTRYQAVDFAINNTLRTYNGTRRNYFDGQSILNAATGSTWDRDLIGTAIERARHTYDATTRSVPYPALTQGTMNTLSWASGATITLGWSTLQISNTRVQAQNWYAAIGLGLANIQRWGSDSGLLTIPGVPASDDVSYVETDQPNGYDTLVESIEVAPDEGTTQTSTYRSDAKWVIMPAVTRTADPNGWGARWSSAGSVNILGNTSGPESLTAVTDAQTITYAGGAAAPFVPISSAIMTAARADAPTNSVNIIIHGLSAAQLSTANPMPDPYGYVAGSNNTLGPTGQRQKSSLILRIGFKKSYRTYALPELFTPVPDGPPPVRDLSQLPGRRRFRPR